MYDDFDEQYLENLFAGFALTGIVSRGETTNQHEMARDAWKIARAMIEQRKKEE